MIGGPAVDEGSPFTLDLSYSDPGDDELTWTIDWGDGSPPTTAPGESQTLTHVYRDDKIGGYAISVTAADEDGDYTLSPITAIVNNVVPILTATGPSSAAEGSFYCLQLSAADPGADHVNWVIDWGDGSALESASDEATCVIHKFPGARGAHFTVSVSASDEDGDYPVIEPIDVIVGSSEPGLGLFIVWRSGACGNISARQRPHRQQGF